MLSELAAMNWMALASVLQLVALQTTTGSGSTHLPAVYSQDFRRKEFDQHVLQLVGKDAEQLVSLATCGLRIVLPARRGKGHKQRVVGIAPNLIVHGDFEITASYQILKVNPGQSDSGVGINLYVVLESDGEDAFSMRRVTIPKEGGKFIVHRAVLLGGERKGMGKNLPTKSAAGKLRLARRGGTLSYLVAEEKSTYFRELLATPVDTANVRLVRLALESSHPSAAAEVCFDNFEVRAERLTEKPPPIVTPSGSPWPWVASTAAGVSALASIVWYIRKRMRRGPRPGPSRPSGRDAA